MKTKKHYRLTADDMSVANEIERMAQHAEKHKPKFHMASLNSKPKTKASHSTGKDVRTYQTRLRDEKANERKRMAQQTKTFNKNATKNPIKRKNPMTNLQKFEILIDNQVAQGVQRHIAVQNAMRNDPELGRLAEVELAAEIKNRQDQTAPHQSIVRPYGQ